MRYDPRMPSQMRISAWATRDDERRDARRGSMHTTDTALHHRHTFGEDPAAGRRGIQTV